MITISNKDFNPFKTNFDYEEDNYDRLKNLNKSKKQYNCFTNKVTLKKVEYDYEEDPYEPEKGR